MKLTKIEKRILKDYEDFRKAQFHFHIKQREWMKMSKKTKLAMIGMLNAVARSEQSSNNQ